MGYGVIGSTSDSGSFSLGSSPSTPADWFSRVFDEPTSGPHRLAAQDTALSRRRHGFKSRWGYKSCWIPLWGNKSGLKQGPAARGCELGAQALRLAKAKRRGFSFTQISLPVSAAHPLLFRPRVVRSHPRAAIANCRRFPRMHSGEGPWLSRLRPELGAHPCRRR